MIATRPARWWPSALFVAAANVASGQVESIDPESAALSAPIPSVDQRSVLTPEQRTTLTATLRVQIERIGRGLRVIPPRIPAAARRAATQPVYAENAAWVAAIRSWRADSAATSHAKQRLRTAASLITKDNPAAATPHAIEALGHSIVVGDVVTAANEHLPRLVETYLRSIAKARAALLEAPKQDLPARTRGSACAPFVSQLVADPNAPVARLDVAASPSLADFYPNSARVSNTEGMSSLRVLVSPEGCVSRAELLVSSGYGSLDNAAFD
jgi:hypothetical protein